MENDKKIPFVNILNQTTQQRILSLESLLKKELSHVGGIADSEGLFVTNISKYLTSNTCDGVSTCPEILTLIKILYNQELNKKSLEKELELSREDALTDSLSTLYNRRIFDREINVLYEEFLRNKREVSIVLIDFDNFKHLNDMYSHQAGDEVIKTFGKILKSKIRNNYDWACRLGGEEFALILPDCNLKNGIEIVSKIQNRLENQFFYFQDLQENDNEITQTISFGIGKFLTSNLTALEHLSNIDKALYKAKNNGKNQGFVVEYKNQTPIFISVNNYNN